jgi:regulator of sirC expression with transglutaminase-like and TPR domain
MDVNKKELEALIKLLDDTDQEVFRHIEDRLVSYGKTVISSLEEVWGNTFDVFLQQRIENIIHKIQFDEIKEDIRIWAVTPGHSLLDAAILVARYQYPDLDEGKIRAQIDQIKKDAWLELNDNLTALEQIKVLNHIFFDVHGFGGNTTNFHAPQNSYINNVLESRKGNPLTLSLLYSEVARSLDVPVFGVNLPEHFVLAYIDNSGIIEINDDNVDSKVLFYVNPFSKGTIFSRKEITAFLKQINVNADEYYYQPCANVEIIQRLVRNLINSYDKLGYPDKMQELARIMGVLGEARL